MKTETAFKKARSRHCFPLIYVIVISFVSYTSALAQSKTPYIHIAKIVVDSAQLENYKVALKLHAETAVSKEPGVLTLYGVYDKAAPTHVTVFEIYASKQAYESHLKTPHFIRYKTSVNDMVKSLELTDVVPIALEAKSK